MSTTVTGRLARAAEHRQSRGGESLVYLLVDDGGFVPFEAIVRLNNYDAAERLAAQCGRDAPVTVTGRVDRLRTDHDASALIVTKVTALNVGGNDLLPAAP